MNDDSIPLAVVQQIDSACDQFESAWKSGNHPRIEDFLAKVDESHVRELLKSLLQVESELSRRDGQPISAELFAGRFPEYADVISEVLETVQAPPQVKSAPRVATNVPTVSMRDASIDTSRLGKTAIAGKLKSPPAVIGRFEIKEVLGEGAFGTVYRANDPQLDREVALKVPRAGVLETQEDVDRFLQEARAAATLRQSHICPIYDFGKIDDHYFLVMAYIKGQPLSAVLTKSKDISPRKIAAAVRKIALALGEAHKHGVVHRDLKPSNIMIDKQGEPVVMDFGLARKLTGDEAQLTHSGAILGTPAYMPPEQARGKSKEVGPTSDVYSLGVILYELSCGQRPFRGAVAEVLAAILYKDPPPPSSHKPDVDPQLEEICRKAMAKKPEERYPTMEDFAQALTEFLRAERDSTSAAPGDSQEMGAFASMADSKPIPPSQPPGAQLAPPREKRAPGKFDPYHKWLGIPPEEQPPSHYRLLGLKPFEDDADVIDAAAERQMSYLHQIAAGPHLADSQRLLNELAAARLCLLSEAKKVAYDAELHTRLASVEDSVDDSIFDEVATLPQRTQQSATRPPWWKTLDRRVVTAGGVLFCVLLGVVIIIRSDDPNLVVTVGTTGKLAAPPAQVTEGAIDDDRPALLIAPFAAETPRDLLAEPLELHRLQRNGQDMPALAVAFTPDSQKLLTANEDKQLRVWDVQTGRLLDTMDTRTVAEDLAVSPDGRYAAWGGVAGFAGIWDIENHELQHSLKTGGRRPGTLMGIDYSPDGKLVAACGHDGLARFWDAQSGREIKSFQTKAPKNGGSAIKFTPDSQTVLVKAGNAGEEGLVQVFDVHSGALKNEFQLGPQSAGGNGLAISPDGRQFAIGNFHRWTIVFDLETGKKIGDGAAGHMDAATVAYSPDSRWIGVGHFGGSIQLLDAKTLKQTFLLRHENAKVAALAFSPDGRFLASATTTWGDKNATGAVNTRVWRLPDTTPLAQAVDAPAADEDASGTVKDEAPFKPLFSGKDLSSWSGDPSIWKVENGAIVTHNENDTSSINKYLVHQDSFTDFELRLQYKLSNHGNSGVQFRGAREANGKISGYQVEIGFLTDQQPITGNLYEEGTGRQNVVTLDDNRRLTLLDKLRNKHWNDLTIRCEGARIIVEINGLRTVDCSDPAGRQSGFIAMQSHGRMKPQIAFRDIRIKDLSASDAAPTELPAAAAGSEWTDLFNGRDLTGWQGNRQGYRVHPGTGVYDPGQLECRTGADGPLYTDGEYDDFILRFDFKLTPGANNGIGLRAPLFGGDAAYSGMEIQILDDSIRRQRPLKPFQYHGSIYGVAAAKPGYLKPVGQWNSQEVRCIGDHIEVILNGTKILDTHIDQSGNAKTADGRDHPGLQRTKGHVALLAIQSQVFFRNIRIKEVSAD